MTVTIAVGVQDRPAAAPKDGPWSPDFKWVNNPSFTSAISAVSGFVFAYGGIPAYFSIVAEMRHPQQYTRALMISHTFMTLIYLVIGGVIYGFCGSYVASPALGSAGGTLKKVCYAMALPGLLVSTALFIHVSSLSQTTGDRPEALQGKVRVLLTQSRSLESTFSCVSCVGRST